MTPITFYVAGTPKGQPRARAASFAGHIRIYSPKDSAGWRTLVCYGAKRFRPALPLEGPIRVDLDFFFPRPKSQLRANGDLRDDAPIFCITKPDRDNADKLILDALTKLRFWLDDCQVCDGRLRKFYATPHSPAGCIISIGRPHP